MKSIAFQIAMTPIIALCVIGAILGVLAEDTMDWISRKAASLAAPPVSEEP